MGDQAVHCYYMARLSPLLDDQLRIRDVFYLTSKILPSSSPLVSAPFHHLRGVKRNLW